MKQLLASLKETDEAILNVIARYWGIDPTQLDSREIPEALEARMMQPEQAERIWGMLDDDLRGVLQTLIGGMGKMPYGMFERFYGTIRKMGKGQIERENPLQNPASPAEALFYRGLIYESYENTNAGARQVVYVPPDFIKVLPTHKTTYDDLDAMEAEAAANSPLAELFDKEEEERLDIYAIEEDTLDGIQAADTTIVDDVTALLAYLQVFSAGVNEEGVLEADLEKMLPYMLKNDPLRLAFLFEVSISAELVEVQQGKAYPRRADTRRWLESSRSAQLKALVEGWRSSNLYRELWQVPGLFPEAGGAAYNPAAARKTLIAFIKEHVPLENWWPLDDFIEVLREIEPDFQRPGGDYDSWYIRNEAGEYLKGFDSWYAVDAPVVEFILFGPMHWLGLMDIAEDAARLNAYGRAFILESSWPQPQEQDERLTVTPEGVLLASRRSSRFDRFQAMRFTVWDAPNLADPDTPPYRYRLTADGVRRAAEQGITTDHIAAFIVRMVGSEQIPESVARLLETWQSGPAANASIEQLLVLRTPAPETMDYILNTPALRRYTGARLGPMAVIVRAEEIPTLRDALGEHGIAVDVVG